MPQPILPLFSDDMIIINGRFAVIKKDNFVYWFQGSLPVFCHHSSDQDSFRSFCSQLINLKNATSAEISHALQVNCEKLSRWARLARAPGNMSTSSVSDTSTKKSKKKPIS
jgi:hypothetical protein